MAVTWSFTEPGIVTPRSVSVYYSTPATDVFGFGLTDGAQLANCGAYVIEVWADANQTLSGGGTVQCWFQSPFAVGLSLSPNGWMRAPDYDITIPAGLAKQGYLPQISTPGLGMPVVIKKSFRVAYAPSGVTLSGGGLTILIDLYAARPGQ